MSDIRFGCQTYTWQMSYEQYADRLDHIAGVVTDSDFTGIEAEVCMLGRYHSNPEELHGVLDVRGLTLAALCLVCDWAGPRETESERIEADHTVAWLGSFPGALLVLCQMPGTDRKRLSERQRNCIACCNEISRRAADTGIVTAFHPNSPAGSVFRTAEDYAYLLEHLDPAFVGFAPDAGHIAKGGMDPTEIFRTYRSLIRHVHYKDMTPDGIWTEMGTGSIDFSTITANLRETGYSGWIMIEDESPRAENDPDGVTRRNGRYVREMLR